MLHLPWIAAHAAAAAAAAAALTCTALSAGAALTEAAGPFSLKRRREGAALSRGTVGLEAPSLRGGGSGEEKSFPPEAGWDGRLPAVKGNVVILRLKGGVKIPSSEGWS